MAEIFGYMSQALLNPQLLLFLGGGVYGGSRSAILLNIPGAPSAVATALEGYPLAKKGLAGQAIGVTVVQSFLGGLIGTVVLAVGAPYIARFAVPFAPRDYFLLAVMGLLLVGSLGNELVARGVFAGALGLFIGFVGLDSQTGHQRFVLGPAGSSFRTYMMLGVSYVVVMIGLFGMSEALVQMRDLDVKPVKQKVDKIVPGWANVIRYLPLSIRSSLLGTIIGALPGTGADIAALLAYDQAKRTTRNPEVPFGEGAMYIHGLNPGPLLMTQSGDVFWFIIGAMFIGNIFLLIFGFTGVKLFTKIVEVPKHILMPIIIILSVVGSFSINNSIMDVYWMIFFGILGYFMKLYNVPVAPTILGIILADLFELNYRRAAGTVGGTIPALVKDIVTHPVSLVLLIAIVIMLATSSTAFKNWSEKRKR